MLSGETVTVIRPVASGTDDMGEPIAGTPTQTQVADVLFDPTASSALTDSLRLNGERIDAEFHFPKTYTASLRGCSIVRDGHTYKVIADIRRYEDGNTPTRWNGVVATKEVLG